MMFNDMPRRCLENKNGAVLIEFALFLPFLIMIIYYLSDISTIYRYKLMAKSVAESASEILLNSSGSEIDSLEFQDISNVLRLCTVGINKLNASKVGIHIIWSRVEYDERVMKRKVVWQVSRDLFGSDKLEYGGSDFSKIFKVEYIDENIFSELALNRFIKAVIITEVIITASSKSFLNNFLNKNEIEVTRAMTFSVI